MSYLFAVLVSYPGAGWVQLQRIVLVVSPANPPRVSEVERALSVELGTTISSIEILETWRLDR
jgi:hypothetical protein